MSVVGDDCNTCVFVTIDPVMFQYYNLALVQLTFIVLQLNRRVVSFEMHARRNVHLFQNCYNCPATNINNLFGHSNGVLFIILVT